MSTMIFEVYDALKEAGATEEKAKKPPKPSRLTKIASTRVKAI